MLPSIKTPRPLPTPIPEADAPFKKGSLWNKGTPRAGTRRKQAFSRQARRSIPDTPNNAKKDTPINVENYSVAPSGAVLAASRTVTLAVKNMTCAVCPLTVKKALEHVAGVQQVSVSYADKTATVQFDEAATTADQLTEATKNAGYPSSIQAEPK
jgi:mercuric ion binding protein